MMIDPEEALDQCLEAFYDESLEAKIAASRKILLMVMDFKNMEFLLNHDQFLSTISRILRDEHKKSTELCTFLLCCFYVLSNYTQFHPLLSQHQLGDTTMKIVEHQTQRFDVRYSEFMEKDVKSKDYDKELKKLNLMIAKQDKLFYICFTVLLNMAEDPAIEKKMKKRKIISFLLRMLERNDFHLLIVSLLFLKKLSIVGENKLQMWEENAVKKLGRFFTCNNNILLQLSLGLTKNLCFSDICRAQIEECGYVPKIVDLLKVANYRFLSIVILYLLSLDEKIRFTFAYTDCMGLIVKLMLHFPEPLLGKELIALAINLSLNQRNADLVSEEELQQIVQRALTNTDVLLLKYVKNVIEKSSSQGVQNCAKGCIQHFIKILVTKGKNEDLKFELIGILTATKLEDQWTKYLNESFIELLHNNLATGIVDDDIILETLMLISTIASNQRPAEILAKNRILQTVSQLYIEKAEDDEFMVQYMYCLYQFLFNKIGIEFILEQEEIIMQMLNALNDKNEKVRTITCEVLDILREYDQDLSEKIKERRFYEHNKEWAEHVEEFQQKYLKYNQYHNMSTQYRMEEGQMAMGYDYDQQEELDSRMWDSDEEQ